MATEIMHSSGQDGFPVETIHGNVTLTDQFVVYEGKTIVIDGDLTIGTNAAPIAEDKILLDIRRHGTLIVKGDVEVARDFDSANPVILVDSSAKLIITQDLEITRIGGGAGECIVATADSTVKVIETVSLLAYVGAAGDGAFLHAYGCAFVYFGQVLFDPDNPGTGLDLGAVASVHLDRGARLYVSDVPGASDALAQNAGSTGILLNGGAQAYLPVWAANSGIGATAAGGGDDQKVGGAAAGNWGGGEVLTDLAAGAPEICMAYKP